MKMLSRPAILILFLLLGFSAIAQNQYSISGTVVDEKGEPAKSATVFVSGTKKITASDAEGKFLLSGLSAGTFQLSVQMIGYEPFSKNVLIKTESVVINAALKIKATALKEVVIGNGSSWDKHYQVFIEKFVGDSKNAKDCTIMNPKVLSFSTNQKVLKADADEFLVIENRRLGYRIRYQLKYFEFDGRTTNYDGETNFEELDGTDKQKKQWAKNRLDAYDGSLMHYLRSVYKKNPEKEGFNTRKLFTEKESSSLVIDHYPVEFDTLVKKVDTTFSSLKFDSFYVLYDAKKVAEQKETGKNNITAMKKGSVIKLYLPEAIIDAKGAYTDYRTFQTQGEWAMKRIGDQLPFEYMPPDKVE